LTEEKEGGCCRKYDSIDQEKGNAGAGGEKRSDTGQMYGCA